MSHQSVSVPTSLAESNSRSCEAQAAPSAPVARSQMRYLCSSSIFTLARIIPLVLFIVATFYQVIAHLLLEVEIPPHLFVAEMIVFGIVGPAFAWVTLHWAAREMQRRERAEGEVDALNVSLQEMHHRIKNNLQTVADLLSLEMSRSPHPVHESLRDSIARIKSIAALHEMLSAGCVGATDITELARCIVETTRRSMARSDQHIEVQITGPTVYLSSKQATAFALVLNELVSNAIAHGLCAHTRGRIEVELGGNGSDVWMRVQDDGGGLPAGFDLNTSRGLGLRIVRTLVEKDLHGHLTLTANGKGTTAWVLFRRGAMLSNEEQSSR